MERKKLVLVDLSDISKTLLGTVIRSAEMFEDSDGFCLRLDFSNIMKDIRLIEDKPNGTHVLYDQIGESELVSVNMMTKACM